MIRADSGRVTYGGADITRKAPHAIARAAEALVPGRPIRHLVAV